MLNWFRNSVPAPSWLPLNEDREATQHAEARSRRPASLFHVFFGNAVTPLRSGKVALNGATRGYADSRYRVTNAWRMCIARDAPHESAVDLGIIRLAE